ncbi:hypothetical protein [Streptomyces sp. NPDC054804]
MRRIATSFCGLEHLSAAEASRVIDVLGGLQRTMDAAATTEQT